MVVLFLLAVAACGHDWSAGDAGDAAGDQPDAPFEDGDAGTEDGAVEAADADADDVGPEDAPVEDAPPVECATDAECDDDNPCTADRCDPSALVCDHDFILDDTACGSEGICCGGVCVGLGDVMHCGSCATVCPGGPNSEPSCDASGCGLRCAEGFADCDTGAPGCETDTLGSETFCGSCGVSCGESDTCLAGTCTPSWRPTSTAGTPTVRRQHCGLWTGSEFLVWGGHDGGTCFTSGGRYDPAADTWRPMATAPGSVVGCHRFSAVWAGTELIVWSGTAASGDTSAEPGGGRYNPVTNSWASMSDPGLVLTPRISPAAAWTGSRLVIWSGVQDRAMIAASDGARYDPVTDSWTPMSSIGAPPGSWSASVVWTGTEMIVWGGWAAGTGGAVSTGGRYDPATDRWTALTTTGAPTARGFARAVWTGREMLVWGGATNGTVAANPNGPLGDGGAYDPATDTWRAMAAAGAPAPRFQNEMVWTGTQAIVWAGTASGSTPSFNDGAQYDPIADRWTPVTTVGAPSARRAGASAWTGSEMVVWGGGNYDGAAGGTVCTPTGGRYRPR